MSMPQFKFKVHLSGTVIVHSRSEEDARKELHRFDDWGEAVKLQKLELIAIDGKPPLRGRAGEMIGPKRPRVLYREGAYRITRRTDTKNGSLQITASTDGKRYRRSGGQDLREAKRRLARLRAEIESGWRPGDQRDDRWQTVARRVWRRHQLSVRDRGIPFDLIPTDVYLLLQLADFRCSVSGIEFSRGEKMGPRGLTDPWAPSLDRIDTTASTTARATSATTCGSSAWQRISR
jgi:hypothetical protein